MPIYPQQFNDWLKSQIPPDAISSGQEIDFQGVQENVTGQLVNIPVVYGYRRVTGPRVFTSTQLGNSRIVYTAIAISEGPITKYHKLFINDEEVTMVENGDGGSYTPTAGTYGGNILTYQLFYGNRTANSLTGTLSGPTSTLLTEITGNAQDIRQFTESMAGIAYIVLKMTWLDQNSPYKSFPKVSVEVSGRKLRNSSTAGYGSEQNVFQDANPADVLLDYLTNTTYGRGMADSKIDYTSISALRSSMATTIIPFINGTATPRAKCNYILDTGRTVLENVKDLCRQFGVVMTLANGVYRFTPEYKTSTVEMTVNKSHIIDGYTITIPDLSVRYNSVTVNYYSSLSGFTQTSENYRDATAISADGKTLDVSVEYSATTDPYQARNIAQTIFLKSRNQKTYNFKMVKEALRLTVGDVITWDPDSTGVSSTRLRIISMSMNPDFTFDISAVTHDNNFYPQFTPLSAVTPQTTVVPTTGGNIVTTTTVTAPIVTSAPAPAPTTTTAPVITTATTTTTKAKITITGLPTLVDTLPGGDNFYPVPIEKFQNQFTQVTDADYRLRTSRDFSINSVNGHYGNFTRVGKEFGSVSTQTAHYYEYKTALSYRHRDLANDTLGGEGIVIGPGGLPYTKIHFVYEIESASGVPKFGWYNRKDIGTGTNWEKCFFDPQSGGTSVTRRTNISLTTEVFTLIQGYRGKDGPDTDPASKTIFGCPYLQYDRTRGYYACPNFNSTGLKYYLRTNIVPNVQVWAIPDLPGGTLPNLNNIWLNKNNGSTPNNTWLSTDVRQRMTIKYFLIDPAGTPYYLTQYTINLDDARPGDLGLVDFRSISYRNYQEAFPLFTPPFPAS